MHKRKIKPKQKQVIEAGIVQVVEARYQTGLSQSQFAKLLGISVRTLQEWEQGRRQPSQAALSLIKIARCRPDVLREILQTETVQKLSNVTHPLARTDA